MLFLIVLSSCNFSTEHKEKIKNKKENMLDLSLDVKNINHLISIQDSKFFDTISSKNDDLSAQLFSSEGVVMSSIVFGLKNLIDTHLSKENQNLKDFIDNNKELGKKTNPPGFYLGFGNECKKNENDVIGNYENTNDKTSSYKGTQKICIVAKNPESLEGLKDNFPYVLNIEDISSLNDGQSVKMRGIDGMSLKFNSVDGLLQNWIKESDYVVSAMQKVVESWGDMSSVKFSEQSNIKDVNQLKEEINNIINQSKFTKENVSSLKNNLYGEICENDYLAIELVRSMAEEYLKMDTKNNFKNISLNSLDDESFKYKNSEHIKTIETIVKTALSGKKYNLYNSKDNKQSSHSSEEFNIKHLNKFLSLHTDKNPNLNLSAVKNICKTSGGIDHWSNFSISNKYLTAVYNEGTKNEVNYIFFNEEALGQTGGKCSLHLKSNDIALDQVDDLCNEYGMIFKNENRRSGNNQIVAKRNNKLNNLKASIVDKTYNTDTLSDDKVNLQLGLTYISEDPVSKGKEYIDDIGYVNSEVAKDKGVRIRACVLNQSKKQEVATSLRLIVTSNNINLNGSQVSKVDSKIDFISNDTFTTAGVLTNVKVGNSDNTDNMYFIDLKKSGKIKFTEQKVEEHVKSTGDKNILADCGNMFPHAKSDSIQSYEIIIKSKNDITKNDINNGRGAINITGIVFPQDGTTNLDSDDNTDGVNIIVENGDGASNKKRDLVVEKWVRLANSSVRYTDGENVGAMKNDNKTRDGEWHKTIRVMPGDEVDYLLRFKNLDATSVSKLDIFDSYYLANVPEIDILHAPSNCQLMSSKDDELNTDKINLNSFIASIKCNLDVNAYKGNSNINESSNWTYLVSNDNNTDTKDGSAKLIQDPSKINELKDMTYFRIKIKEGNQKSNNAAIYSMITVEDYTGGDAKEDANIDNNLDFAHIFITDSNNLPSEDYKTRKENWNVDTFLGDSKIKNISNGSKIENEFKINYKSGDKKVDITTLFLTNNINDDIKESIDYIKDNLKIDNKSLTNCVTNQYNLKLYSIQCKNLVASGTGLEKSIVADLSNNDKLLNLLNENKNGGVSIISIVAPSDTSKTMSAEDSIGRGLNILVGGKGRDVIVQNTVRSNKTLLWDGGIDNRYHVSAETVSDSTADIRVRNMVISSYDTSKKYNIVNYVMGNGIQDFTFTTNSSICDSLDKDYIKTQHGLPKISRYVCKDITSDSEKWSYPHHNQPDEKYSKDIFNHNKENLNNDERLLNLSSVKLKDGAQLGTLNTYSIISGDDKNQNNISTSSLRVNAAQPKVYFTNNTNLIDYDIPTGFADAYDRLPKMIVLDPSGVILKNETSNGVNSLQCKDINTSTAGLCKDILPSNFLGKFKFIYKFKNGGYSTEEEIEVSLMPKNIKHNLVASFDDTADLTKTNDEITGVTMSTPDSNVQFCKIGNHEQIKNGGAVTTNCEIKIKNDNLGKIIFVPVTHLTGKFISSNLTQGINKKNGDAINEILCNIEDTKDISSTTFKELPISYSIGGFFNGSSSINPLAIKNTYNIHGIYYNNSKYYQPEDNVQMPPQCSSKMYKINSEGIFTIEYKVKNDKGQEKTNKIEVKVTKE